MVLSLLLVGIIAPWMISADSGSGTTTRYWDCCKPSCAWAPDALGIQSSVISCDANDQPLSSNTLDSGCVGGPAYMCSNQSPWAVSDTLAYGFAAVNNGPAQCCQCYQLTFTGGPATGKVMVVQATNTGSDVGATAFDIAMPGGGFGMFDGCSSEWGASPDVWGQQWGGMMSNNCGSMPAALQPGCQFRWGSFFAGSDNVPVDWETVTCPLELTQKSGCVRIGDNPTPGGGGPSAASTTATPPAASSAFSTVVISIASTAISIPIPTIIPSISIPSFSIPSLSIPTLSIIPVGSNSISLSVSASASAAPTVPSSSRRRSHGHNKFHSTASPPSSSAVAAATVPSASPTIPVNPAAGVNAAPPGFTEIVFSVPHTLVTITVPVGGAAAMPWTVASAPEPTTAAPASVPSSSSSSGRVASTDQWGACYI